jgi:hypothetical protein
MTLQLLHSEFTYIRGKFDFLFYQCGHWVEIALDYAHQWKVTNNNTGFLKPKFSVSKKKYKKYFLIF